MSTTLSVSGLSNRSFWLLRSASFVSNFDRFSITPMLVLIGLSLDVPLRTVVLAASGYYLCYGLMQPIWGLASDRIGRVVVMRIAFGGAAFAACVSALAPNMTLLIVGRAVAGACFAAAIATTLTYVGDTVPARIRQRPLSDLMTTLAMGTALATLVAGVLAHYVSWRLVFGLPGLLALYLAIALRRLPEPDRAPVGSLLEPIKVVVRSRWQWLVLVLALVEGIVLLGFLAYLAPALESHGVSPSVSGAVAALYGVGAMAASQIVKRLVGRWSPTRIILVGGIQMAVAYGLAATSLSIPAVALTAFLLGGGWSFMHSTLQTWATLLSPTARATGIALFGVALYVGSAVATTVAAGAADRNSYQSIFLVAAGLAVPLTIVATIARRRYTVTAANGAS